MTINIMHKRIIITPNPLNIIYHHALTRDIAYSQFSHEVEWGFIS